MSDYIVKTVHERTLDEIDRLTARRAAEDHLSRQEAEATPNRLGRRTIADIAAQAVEELAVRNEYGVLGLSTGIAALDEALGPALQPSRTIGIAADTKSGKSTIAGNFACAFAAQGVPVLVASLEDDPTDTVYKYVSNLTATDIGLIRGGFRTRQGGRMAIPADFDGGIEQLAAMGMEFVTRQGTAEQLAFEAKDWSEAIKAKGHDFGVLILDQLSHLVPTNAAVFAQKWPGYPPPPRNASKREMMVWQVKMLNRVARKLNLLIVVLMQMTLSQTRHEKPSHHDLREAKEAAFEFDALLIPYRPSKLRNEARGQGEPEYVDNVEDRAWILCPIARKVQSFEVEVQWDGAHQRFLDLNASAAMPWQGVKALDETQLEGMRRLAALRSSWEEREANRFAAANGVLDAEVVDAVPAKVSTGPALLRARPASTAPLVDPEAMKTTNFF